MANSIVFPHVRCYVNFSIRFVHITNFGVTIINIVLSGLSLYVTSSSCNQRMYDFGEGSVQRE
jgi:hypothetical protein